MMFMLHTITKNRQKKVNNGYLPSGTGRSEWDEYEHVLLLVRKRKSK